MVLCKISFDNRTVATHALIDCGATGIAFIDEDFARHHQLPLTPLQYPRSLEVIDGRPISSGDITHVANTRLAILQNQETLPMFVTKLGHYPVVLSIPWLELHDVAIRFSSRTLTFGLQYCTSHCNQAPTIVHAHSLASKIAHGEPVVSAGAGEFEARLSMSPDSNFFHNEVDETNTFQERVLPESSGFHETSALPEMSTESTFRTPDRSTFPTPDTDESTFRTSSRSIFWTPDRSMFPMKKRHIQISTIGGQPFRRLAYKQKLTIFSTSLYEINQALGVGTQAKKPKELDLQDYVPAEYHEFLPLFLETLPKNLPPHRPYDHKIPLREGFMPRFGPLYSMF